MSGSTESAVENENGAASAEVRFSTQGLPHMAYDMTHDQGPLLLEIGCSGADSMLQGLTRWYTNIRYHDITLKHSTHLSLSRRGSRSYRLRNQPLLLEDPNAIIRLSKMTLLGSNSSLTACGGTLTLRNPPGTMANRYS